MGTNYYATFVIQKKDFEGTPYKVIETIHIGKSSTGWVFTWHGYKAVDMPKYLTAMDMERIVTVDDWIRLLETGGPYKIEDEYGREMDVQEFLIFALSWNRGRLVEITDHWGGSWHDTYNGVTYSFSAGDWS